MLCKSEVAPFIFERPIRFRDIKRLTVMNSSLQRIKAWRARRRSCKEQRSLERWEQIRARGKQWFVFRTALTYGLVFVGATNAVENLFDGPQSISLFKVIFFGLFGVGMGLSEWSDMESKYKTALNEARAKASPSGELPPYNSPSQITAD